MQAASKRQEELGRLARQAQKAEGQLKQVQRDGAKGASSIDFLNWYN